MFFWRLPTFFRPSSGYKSNFYLFFYMHNTHDSNMVCHYVDLKYVGNVVLNMHRNSHGFNSNNCEIFQCGSFKYLFAYLLIRLFTHSHMSSFNLAHHNLTKVGPRTLLELAALFTSLKLLYIQIYIRTHSRTHLSKTIEKHFSFVFQCFNWLSIDIGPQFGHWFVHRHVHCSPLVPLRSKIIVLFLFILF